MHAEGDGRAQRASARISVALVVLTLGLAHMGCRMGASGAADASGAAPASAGCQKDSDCKGDRICEHGMCTAPAVAAPGSAPPTQSASDSAEAAAEYVRKRQDSIDEADQNRKRLLELAVQSTTDPHELAQLQAQLHDAEKRAHPITTVVTFTPSLPSGTSRDGECWTDSIAAPGRTDAWRCMSGHNISDPCFSIVSRNDVLVCRPNPFTGDPGFILRLTKPVPARVVGTPSPEPWLIRLIDGQTCGLITGTIPVIHGEGAPWGCTRGWVTRIDRGGTSWSAEWYAADSPEKSLDPLLFLPATSLAVTTAWQ